MKYNYTTDYNHPHYYSGNIFTSNRYGRYRILGKLLNHNRRGYYVIQFEETGHTTKAYCSAIKSGKVADRSYDFGNEEERREALMRPVIHGVGYIGIGQYRTYVPYTPETYGQRTKEYVLWQNMIARCYYTRNGKQDYSDFGPTLAAENLEQHGKPLAFYSDKHGIFRVNVHSNIRCSTNWNVSTKGKSLITNVLGLF
ncbi:hypothetical protein [Salmonella enterica]|uniref:hypothetical protein n=1 Tax=Salmonella enterica TaxID=28901 RepID=UPI000A6D34E0|nr:hypothetical protein [Salmonella enterica]